VAFICGSVARRTPQLESIIPHIVYLRGHRVLLDSDLASLYGVPTKVLVQAVKRNHVRFPSDFLFALSEQEVANLRSQIVTSSSPPRTWGGRRYRPFAFTEQGVAMLSSVLHSPRAVAVNIAIMRAFVRLREMAGANAELAKKLDELERKVSGHDATITDIVRVIRELAAPVEARPKRRIGFVSTD
jgi:ORF6N domain